MSYGIEVRAATKAKATRKVALEFNKIVAAQPVHAHDHAQAFAATAVFIGVLMDDPTKDVFVQANGSVSCIGSGNESVTGVSLAVTACLVKKDAA